MQKNLLIVVNEPAFFLSHRLPIALAAQREGYRVIVATGPGPKIAEIEARGLDHRELPLSRSSTNPLGELRAFISIARLIRSERPDILHLVTIKPVLYGGMLSRLLRVPAVVAAISGMGYLFMEERSGLLQWLSRWMYKLALGHPNGRVIVQNDADRAALRAMGALRAGADTLIPGSGVDLNAFYCSPMPQGTPIVVLPARMLWDKGVMEFVQAAARLLALGVKARFVLCGPHDPHNPSGVSLDQLQRWQAEGPVEWWGQRDDMPEVLAAASLVVLPSSYREGVPKALLEALAAGRAIVTTDSPGCRDVVEPGKNGLLVPVRNAEALADTIRQLLDDRPRLEAMGQCGRQKAESEYGIERVVKAHLALYRSLEGGLKGQGREQPE